ncbi:YSIRK-type signal peptide-containing protein, partial [Streptococcus saliviloxodontae]
MFNHNHEKKLKFSIRKFSVGVGSVVIGALLFLSPQVLADELGTTATQEVPSEQVASLATTVTDSSSVATSTEGVATTNAEVVSTNTEAATNTEVTSTNSVATSTESVVTSDEAASTQSEPVASTADTTSEPTLDSTPVAVASAPVAAATADTRTYSTSGTWALADEYADNDLVVEDVAASKGYATATTSIAREDGTVVNVTASIKPVDGNPEGIGYLANGADQSKYGATAEMFVGNPNPSTIPALGILTQPSDTEGGGDLRDKLNFSGKEASTILTLTFDQEVTNPIIDLSGVGGNSRIRFVTGYSRGSFNATYFELLTSDVTLEKASEGVNLTVTDTSIEVTDKNAFHRSVVDPTYSGFDEDSNRMPNVSPAGTGSIRLKGTFKEVQFKLYHESTPFTSFPTDEYETGTSYFINTSTTSNQAYSIGSDKINGNNKHYNDYVDYRNTYNNETTNSDLLRFSLRLENSTEQTGSVIVNYIDTDGNVIGTEYKDSTDVAVGTAYNTA